MEVVNFRPNPLYPQKKTPVATEQKAAWSPEPVCTVVKKRKLFAPTTI